MPEASLLCHRGRQRRFRTKPLKPAELFSPCNLIKSQGIGFPEFLPEFGLPSQTIENVVSSNPVLLLSRKRTREPESMACPGRSRIRIQPCLPQSPSGPIANLRMRVLVNAWLRTSPMFSYSSDEDVM